MIKSTANSKSFFLLVLAKIMVLAAQMFASLDCIGFNKYLMRDVSFGGT